MIITCISSYPGKEKECEATEQLLCVFHTRDPSYQTLLVRNHFCLYCHSISYVLLKLHLIIYAKNVRHPILIE